MDEDTGKVCTTYLKALYFVYIIMLGIDGVGVGSKTQLSKWSLFTYADRTFTLSHGGDSLPSVRGAVKPKEKTKGRFSAENQDIQRAREGRHIYPQGLRTVLYIP